MLKQLVTHTCFWWLRTVPMSRESRSIDSIGLLDSHSKTMTILVRRVVWDINSTVPRIQRNHQSLFISQDHNDPCKKHNPSLTGTVIFAQTLFMLGHFGLLHPRSCWHACVSPWFSMTYEAKNRMSNLEMTKLSQEYCTVCRNLCLSQRRNYVYQNEQHQTLLTVSLADAGCSFIFSSFKVLKFKPHFLWGNPSTNLHVGCNSQRHPRFQTQIISNIIILIKYLAYPSSTTNKSTNIQSVYPQ